MATKTLSAALEAAKTRMSTTTGATVGVALSTLAGVANSAADEAVWLAGDTCMIPDRETLESLIFERKFGNGKTYGVLLETTNGDVRQLYFTTLKKNVSVSDENGKATGERVHSNTDFYKEVMKQPTLAAIFELLASKKSITVQKVDNVVTAAYREGVIVGSRTTTVPYFVAEERPAEQPKEETKKK